MTITTVAVGAAVAPTVLKTYISHYTNRKPRHQKPTAHISYDEGLHLIRTFLKYASHHSVEDLQSFTTQWVPSPSWVKTENVTIPKEHISHATRTLIDQLGPTGIEQVGGTKWWQWRQKGAELKAEWIDMRSHYNERKRENSKSRRIMLYVHGGGYFFGSVDEHRYQMQRHARKLKARVFAPRYRLSPQFPFPCGLQDCLAAYLYLLTIHDPTEIIFAGDSAGGGMVVAMLCLLRDQNLPLPAGAILISPWVDLTHSFPSLSGYAEMDYIPPYGFMQKPSASWPPPNQEELATIRKLAKGDKTVQHETQTSTSVPDGGDGAITPGPQLALSIELDGKTVLLKDQIQMYATNQLLAHPLVSPVLQPSLGGLPPVLILTGGAEILRDEQIYLAHKMANPSKYPLGAAYRSKYDPDDTMLKKYKPTPVQLQVWDDLCHVTPTLSFTRPAKHMYRSIAQFGAWVLAKAQKRAIDIVDDDNISFISSQTDSGSQTDGEPSSPTDSIARAKLEADRALGSVGRAGDPIPPFENHMIRQRIDRHGMIYPLAEPHELPALQMHADAVGVIKPGPVRKWLAAKNHWDTRYASTRRKVQRERVKALSSGKIMGFEAGEHPPPSALAGRRTDKDLTVKKRHKSYGLAMWSGWGSRHDESTLKREEEVVEAEPEPEQEKPARAFSPTIAVGPPMQRQPVTEDGQNEGGLAPLRSLERHRRRSLSSKRTMSGSRTLGRKRTVSVTDRGQADGRFVPPVIPPPISTVDGAQPPAALPAPTSPEEPRTTSPNPSLLSAGFIPQFQSTTDARNATRNEGHKRLISDTASTKTGRTGILPDDASTTAVFAAPGISKNLNMKTNHINGNRSNAASLASTTRPNSPLMNDATSFFSNINHDEPADDDDRAISLAPSVVSKPIIGGHGLGSDTPRSQRSLDRLQSHQPEFDEGANANARSIARLRSPSQIAVVRAEGVIDAHEPTSDEDERSDDPRRHKGGELDNFGVRLDAVKNPPERQMNVSDGAQQDEPERPKMYNRGNTEFQTALEKISQ